MKCISCNSSDVHVEVFQEQEMKRKRSNALVALFTVPLQIMKWIFFTPVLFIRRLFGSHKKYEINTKIKKLKVCNTCGFTEEF